MIKNKKLILPLIFFSLFSFSSNSKIYFDLEEEPLPIVDLTVVLPFGHQTLTEKESGLSMMAQEMLAAGTLTKDRQAFNDQLAKFGAEYSFSVGNHYSYWSLKLPFIKDKDYTPLIALLTENWNSPRFTDKEFKLASLKIEASFKSSLDSDSSLLSSAMKNFLNKKYLGGHPAFLDIVKKNASLEATKEFFNQRIKSVKDVWVGAVAPDDSQDLMEKIVATIFAKQGSVRRSKLKEALPTGAKPEGNIKPEKTFIVVDREGREQTIMGFMALSPESLSQGNELEFFFADYLLFSNGLDSYFASVIRGQKGLAYGANSLVTQYRDHKVLSLLTNPQASKMDEAFKTVSELTQTTLEKSDKLKIINDKRWSRVFNSFQNLKALENGLPGQRLGNRMGVVTGSQSYKVATSDPTNWKVKRENVASLLEDHWKKSAIVIGAVGSSKAILPLLKKYFPDYKVKIIPYRDVIYSKAY
ncbi:insulinase family protein [bacterium]|nr:insulinase family protein [bacterium]